LQVDDALQSCRLQTVSSALDWLCLNVPEGQLPKGFDAKGTQFDVRDSQ
jgi:hypothetical protein